MEIKKKKTNKLIVTTLDAVYSILMALSAVGILALPEWIFNAFNGFIAVLGVLLIVFLVVSMVVSRKDLKKVCYKAKEPTLSNFASTIKLGALNRLINYILIGLCLLNYSKFSKAFTIILLLNLAISLLMFVISNAFWYISGVTSKERVILSFENSKYHRDIVNEYKDIKASMLMEADISDKELRKELRKVQDEYYYLIKA